MNDALYGAVGVGRRTNQEVQMEYAVRRQWPQNMKAVGPDTFFTLVRR